jgi:transcriptional regulator GlxA family with amidase domain
VADQTQVERAIVACRMSSVLIEDATARIAHHRAFRAHSAARATDWSKTRGVHAGEVLRARTEVDRLHAAVTKSLRTAAALRALVASRGPAAAPPATPRPGTADPTSLPPTVALAVRFIERNAARPITAAQIAEAAGVTVRAVQIAFRRHVGSTPLEYLRDVRLARARSELLAGDPLAGTTVTSVAARWQLSNSSRFAQYYRAAFGELPRQTLYRTLFRADSARHAMSRTRS